MKRKEKLNKLELNSKHENTQQMFNSIGFSVHPFLDWQYDTNFDLTKHLKIFDNTQNLLGELLLEFRIIIISKTLEIFYEFEYENYNNQCRKLVHRQIKKIIDWLEEEE